MTQDLAPRFDAAAFGRSLAAAMALPAPVLPNAVAQAAGVSHSTVRRAMRGWPDLSHENWLRLHDWIDERDVSPEAQRAKGEAEAACAAMAGQGKGKAA